MKLRSLLRSLPASDLGVRRIVKRPSPGIHDGWSGVGVTGTRAIVYQNEHMALGPIGPALARVIRG